MEKPNDAADAWERPGAGVDRRAFLKLSAVAAIGSALAQVRADADAPAAAASPRLVRFPEKDDLILLADRPPNLEMPAAGFASDYTTNEQFFVRWHLSGIPTRVNPATFSLSVGGHVEAPLDLSLDDLRTQFEPATLTAVCQCSGNSRAHFSPRVPGGQWGDGAIGNARWKGVRLADLLRRAKIKPGAVDVTFSGLDKPPQPSVPAFVKSLPAAHAADPDLLVAYEMNGKALPMLNGYPLRLIVPGWYSTYWVKSLSDIEVLDHPFAGFWMAKAYRVPDNPECKEIPGKLAKTTVPIGAMLVRSLLVAPEVGANLKAGSATEIQGLAIGDGREIARVEASTDGGRSWSDATLDPSLGKYAWRRWRLKWTPAQPGPARILSRATDAAGRTQPAEQNWNRSGYARNVIEGRDVIVR